MGLVSFVSKFHSLKRSARIIHLALYWILLQSGVSLAQTSITAQVPFPDASWMLNGTSYAGSTTIVGQSVSTVSTTNLVTGGVYQFMVNSVSTNPQTAANGGPNPVEVSTSANWGINGSGANLGLGFQLTSNGAPSTPSGQTVISSADVNPKLYGYTTGLYANTGASLSITASDLLTNFQILSYGSNQTAVYSLTSTGGSGSSEQIVPSSDDPSKTSLYQAPQSTYAMDGGSVSFSLSSSSSITLTGTVPTLTQTLPWDTQAAGIFARSSGGVGGATWYALGGKDNPPYAGVGGNGGAVNVSIGSGVSIMLDAVTSSSAPMVGILASSIGGAGGVCCNSKSNGGSYPVTLSTAPPGYLASDSLTFGQNGNGSTVVVDLSGSIVSSQSNVYGIVASSIGASTQINSSYTTSSLVASSGVGGDVTVSLAGGDINLTGSNSIGIFAASLSDQVMIAPTIHVTGSGNQAGKVAVTLDNASSVNVGNPNVGGSGMSAGVVAISSTGWLFQPVGAPVSGSVSAGNGGPVTVINGGTITATGASAFGIVALSLGNGGVLSNAPGVVSSVTHLSGSGVGSTQINSGGAVSVTNSGQLITSGNAAIGILAASNGSGGVIVNIPDVVYSDSPQTNTSGISIGTPSSGFVAGVSDSTYAAPGGSVTLINSGSITSGGGVAAIGVLAQSIGGGGAALTQGVALFVGDTGGAGGDGGQILINNQGTISTSGDGSVGLLAQSIGGGGGHAANSSGLFVALGGQGGSGGSGGAVSAAFQSGSFATTGDFASGAVLQSIGGGGGNGGFGKAVGIFVGVSIGGTGGSGGAGSAVTVESANGVTYSATTTGNQSHGLMLQSIGGGGGMGGHAYSASGGAVFAGAVSIGGNGAVGGDGGAVSVCAGSTSSPSCANSSWKIRTAGNDAFGLLMQSIGGGGGYGGGAVAEAYSVSGGDVPAISVSIGVGGSGAIGANGGSVSASGDFTINTVGTGSHAVFAQSIGGGGGVGADSTAGANSYNASEKSVVTSASVGGNGGGGGNGGTVTLTIGSSGSLLTLGHNASGIFTQSVGGGGGVAAVGNAATNDTSLGDGQYAVSLALGGTGGSGGSGSAVTINNGAPVRTIGTQSSGLVVQSIGGGGGYAGNAGAQGAAGTGGNHAMEVVVGGSAGGGGAGGAVTVVSTGTITTGIQLDLASSQTNSLKMSQPIVLGGDSHGIIAQSIGGGGGVGGNADPTAQILGKVQGLLNTAAADWDGLKGNAQFVYGKLKGLSLGTSGDSAESTPDSGAEANGTGSSTDATTDSGGDSGSDSTPAAALPINYNASVAVGGKGGAGGSGGAVSVTATGAITTHGPRSYGILAQSIGGGGGIGGSSTSSSAFVSGSASANLTAGLTLGLGINVGGAGGDGGSGGVVTINGPTTGSPLFINTSGYASVGILAQSIGGGGGVGHDGSVFSPSGTVGTGFTKGSSYTTPTVNLGSVTNGSAGMSGIGGTVNVGSSASPFQSVLVTLGDDSSGLLAQSIGGGGGLASVGCTNSINGSRSMNQANFSAVTSPSACYQNSNSTSFEGNLVPSAFLGGSTGQAFDVSVRSGINAGAAHGGDINLYLNSSSTVITQGNRSIGLVAQSIGGGGGYMTAPSYVFQTASLPSGSTNTAIGGNITVNFANSGTPFYNAGIYTDGDGSWGLLVQSIGGGGGFLGDPNFAISSVPVANNHNAAASANGPNGGDISITFGSANGTPNCQSCVPTIVTSGSNAHGIFAQSIGGGGGVASAGSVIVGSSSGSSPANLGAGGAINIDFYGNMYINGDNSIGIFAQSAGNTSSSGAVSINVYGNIYFPFSSGNNAAIMISGGSTNKSSPNTILVNGNIESNSNIYAIWSDYGYTNVVNNGYIGGSVDLGSTPGEFTNNGQFSAGPIVVVANNSLHNYGVMKIGSEKSVSTTNMKGRLYQHETGKFVVTVDSTNALQANDKIIINGTAIMQGQIVIKAPTLLSGAYPFLSANNVTTSATVKPSHVFTWGLNSSSSTMTLTLNPADADFTPDAYSLTDNQGAVADYLQRHWSASNAALAPLFGYIHEFERGDHDSYAATLNQISGQVLNSQAIQMKTAFSTSLSDSLSCPKVSSQGLKFNQTSCVWAQVSGDLSEQSSNSSNLGFRSRAGGIRLGAQKALDNQWSTGFGLGYQQNYLTSSGLTSNGQFFDASLSLQKRVSAWSFGGSLAFAQGWFKNNRMPQLFGNGVAESLAEQHRSDARMSMMGLRFRAAHEFEQKNYYIKPYVDLDLIYSYISGYTESGGALALRANSSNQLNVAITPMIEFGTDLVTDGKRRIKAYVGAGASFLPNNNVSTQMAFANGSNLGSFNVMTNGPSVLGRLNLGIQAYESDNFEVRAEYGLQAGGGYWNQQLSVNLAYRF